MRRAIAALTALFILFSNAHAQAVTASCAMQFFATGMIGKSVSIFAPHNTFAGGSSSGNAPFGTNEAEVRFTAPASNGELLVKRIEATFSPPASDCKVDKFIITNINYQGFPSGQCFKVKQKCPSNGETVYGHIYIDLWCTVPTQGAFPGGTYKTAWFQSTVLETCWWYGAMSSSCALVLTGKAYMSVIIHRNLPWERCIWKWYRSSIVFCSGSTTIVMYLTLRIKSQLSSCFWHGCWICSDSAYSNTLKLQITCWYICHGLRCNQCFSMIPWSKQEWDIKKSKCQDDRSMGSVIDKEWRVLPFMSIPASWKAYWDTEQCRLLKRTFFLHRLLTSSRNILQGYYTLLPRLLEQQDMPPLPSSNRRNCTKQESELEEHSLTVFAVFSCVVGRYLDRAHLAVSSICVTRRVVASARTFVHPNPFDLNDVQCKWLCNTQQ